MLPARFLLLQALALHAAAVALRPAHLALAARQGKEEPGPAQVDAEQEEAAKTLQDEIDELHAMLKDQFSKDEDAVEDVMEQANETEDSMQKAAETSEELVEAAEDGNVTKANKTIEKDLEKTEEHAQEAEKDMKKFKSLAHEKLHSMKERARKMMIKYRDLAGKAELALRHAEDLEHNLTRAHDSMDVARATLHASMLQSQEAYDLLGSELDGLHAAASAPVDQSVPAAAYLTVGGALLALLAM